MPTPSHGSLPEPTLLGREPILFYCLALAVFGAELSMAALVQMPHGFSLALLQHGLVVLLLTAWMVQRDTWRYSPFAALLFVMTAAAGPFGAGVVLVAALLYAICAQSLVSPAEWIEAFFSDQENKETSPSELLPARLSNSDNSVEPFQDILTGGSVLQKQMAIAKITRYFRPPFAPLLLQAVNDSNAAVRVQAATALAKIERDFTAQFLRLERSLKQSPTAKLQLQLARLCDEYAHAGLQSADSQRQLRRKAIAIYEASLAGRDDYDMRLRLARLYMREGEADKTYALLKPDIDSGDTTPSAILWYMEALFRLKEMPELRRLAKRYGKALRPLRESMIPGEMADVLNVWSTVIDNAAYRIEDSYAARYA